MESRSNWMQRNWTLTNTVRPKFRRTTSCTETRKRIWDAASGLFRAEIVRNKSLKEYHYEFLYIWLDLVPFHSFCWNLCRKLFAHEARIDGRYHWSVGYGLKILDYFKSALNGSHITLVNGLVACFTEFFSVHGWWDWTEWFGNWCRFGEIRGTPHTVHG
jgi:hypothetical protein